MYAPEDTKQVVLLSISAVDSHARLAIDLFNVALQQPRNVMQLVKCKVCLKLCMVLNFGNNFTNLNRFLSERDYVTFGYLPSQFGLSVVCLSVVCNVCTSYSAGWHFRQCFYTILYRGHPLTSRQNFTEIGRGELLRRKLNAIGVGKYSDVGHVEVSYISETMQDTVSVKITDQ